MTVLLDVAEVSKLFTVSGGRSSNGGLPAALKIFPKCTPSMT
jgi:hypothetical protein